MHHVNTHRPMTLVPQLAATALVAMLATACGRTTPKADEGYAPTTLFGYIVREDIEGIPPPTRTP